MADLDDGAIAVVGERYLDERLTAIERPLDPGPGVDEPPRAVDFQEAIANKPASAGTSLS